MHTETSDGTVIPVWEEVDRENVVVLKDIMRDRQHIREIELVYDRIPITAERPPDFSDLSELIDVVLRSSRDTPIVVNCQLGRGRSTLVSIILLLIRQWLDAKHVQPPSTPRLKTRRTLSMSATTPMEPMASPHPPKVRKSYQVINSESRILFTCRDSMLHRFTSCHSEGNCGQEYRGRCHRSVRRCV